MTVKELSVLSEKIKEVSNYIFSLSEKEEGIEERIDLLSINTKVCILDSKVLQLMQNKLDN